MNIDFMTLGLDGLFIWPAFIFTFAALFILYSKTIKELKQQEKKFLSEIKQEKTIKIRATKEKRALSEEIVL